MWIIFNIFVWPIAPLWVHLAVPFRAYARSIVYNYVLQNNKRNWLKRLWERNPVAIFNPDMTIKGWRFYNDHHLLEGGNHKDKGVVACRKVSALKFYIVVFLVYGVLDDDSNQDTTDFGYIKTITEGNRQNDLVGRLFGRFLKKAKLETIFGSAFDLGDMRGEHLYYNFWCTLVWTMRNRGMNFKYLWQDY